MPGYWSAWVTAFSNEGAISVSTKVPARLRSDRFTSLVSWARASSSVSSEYSPFMCWTKWPNPCRWDIQRSRSNWATRRSPNCVSATNDGRHPPSCCALWFFCSMI